MSKKHEPLEAKFKNKTEADERKMVDYVSYKCMCLAKEFNDKSSIIKITHVNVRINHPINQITYKYWWQRIAASVGKWIHENYGRKTVNEEVADLRKKQNELNEPTTP